ncbi:MAG: Era-like GTP-binding protein, partial [Gammaproteobacteria bacterium]|nr:Era-like GTP-binding protein [Gammaproteobacteria bacterium]
MDQARESLRALVEDPRVPDRVRASLSSEFEQVQTMLDKLEQGHLHIAVFGRVSVGKSALLNALLDRQVFSTSPLHGETREMKVASWEEREAGGVCLIDTPGINEVEGEDRERMAHEVAGRADLILFVVEGDITDTEFTALRMLVNEGRPVLLVLNKVDRYSGTDRDLLLATLRERTRDLLPSDRILAAAADPAERVYIQLDEQGNETEQVRRPAPDVAALRERLWTIL